MRSEKYFGEKKSEEKKSFYLWDESREILGERMYIIKIKYFHAAQISRKEFFNFALDFW